VGGFVGPRAEVVGAGLGADRRDAVAPARFRA